MKPSPHHLVTAICYEHEPTLYKIASAKNMIRDAKERIAVEERKDVGGVFFDSREQRENIAKWNKIIDRLRNYVRNEIIKLITQS